MGQRKRDDLTRRGFLRATGLGLAGAAALGGLGTQSVSAAEQAKSVVARVRCAAAAPEAEASVFEPMLLRGLQLLPGADDGLAALKRLVAPEDVVGLKLNLLGGPGMCNTRGVVEALVNLLQRAGIPPGNIIVWERFERHVMQCGWELSDKEGQVRCLATKGRIAAIGNDEHVFWEGDPPDRKGNRRSYFTRILTELCTKVINLPILKDHIQAGITGALKNMAYGSVDNTARTHPAPYRCDPFTAEIMSQPVMREKVVLHLMDAVKGQYEGGPQSRPQFQWPQRELLLSTDPVAVDALALQMIEQQRKDAGLRSLLQTDRPPKHIHTCAERELGTDDLKLIEVRSATI